MKPRPIPAPMPTSTKPTPLTITIVGGGIGGLMLGIMLDRLGPGVCSYHILERTAVLKERGGAISLNSSVLPVFDQLGFLEEVDKLSKLFKAVNIWEGSTTGEQATEPIKLLGTMDYSQCENRYGYHFRCLERSALFKFLLSKIDPSKISLNKNVVALHQDPVAAFSGKATVFCADNTSYQSDLVIGCDGVRSTIRSLMYADLSKQGLLPSKDMEPMKLANVTMVGVTPKEGGLDITKFPLLKEKDCSFNVVVASDQQPYMWGIVSMPNDRLSWQINYEIQADTKGKKTKLGLGGMATTSQDWSLQVNQQQQIFDPQEIQQFQIPNGQMLKPVIDATPKEDRLQLVLEEKCFQTWFHGRVGLVGDSCKKLLPSSGEGAANAIYDCVALANCIFAALTNQIETLNDRYRLTGEVIEKTLKAYQDFRVPFAKEALARSSKFNVLFTPQAPSAWRQKYLANIPINSLDKMYQNRPQLAYLPMVPDRGSEKALPQQKLEFKTRFKL